jgi:gamma-glutamylcyclotransferase (GGCT)/AIG2-like uncharacterized protein YtfP
MTLYFAYGSNMHREDMAQRCPGAVPVGTAVLPGWRYFIMREGYASVRRDLDACVHGVLWRVNAEHLRVLDAYEDLQSGLYRREYLTVRAGGRKLRALVYVGGSDSGGAPTPDYQACIDTAAEAWRLPARYRRALRRSGRAS